MRIQNGRCLLICLVFGLALGCASGKPSFEPIGVDLHQEIPPDLLTERAVILLEEDRLEIQGDEAIHDYVLVKKILESGHPEEGRFSFGSNKYREIISIQGRAVYPDGREETLSEHDISLVPSFADFVLYSDSRSHLFAFPGTRAGTIIEIGVRSKLKNLVYWDPALFQGHLPIVMRRYLLAHAPNAKYDVRALNMPASPARRTVRDDGMTELVWETSNVKPFEQEDMMPPAIEYLPSLWFSTHEDVELGADISLDSWNGIVRWYEEIAEDLLEPPPELTTLVETLCTRSLPDKSKARRLYRWVQGNLRYVAIYLGLGGYIPHDIDDILENRYGDCKDQSIVLAAALREAGIDAHLVLVRTTDNGRLDSPLPSPSYFNHVIVVARIDDEDIYLDPTCDTCSFGVLPAGDQGADALFIRPEENELARLPGGGSQPNAWDVRSEAVVSDNGDASIQSVITFEGCHSAWMRRALSHRRGDTKLEVVQKWFADTARGMIFEKLEIEGEDPKRDRLTITATCRLPSMLNPDKKMEFVQTILYPLWFEIPDAQSRRYDVAFGISRSSTYRLAITLPDKWTIASTPSPVQSSNGHFDYSCSWEQHGQEVVISRFWEVKKPDIPALDYGEVAPQLEAVRRAEDTKILVNRN